MARLIGCMMVMNAADLLSVSLGTLGPLVDEMVVVDGGSTDNTRALARKLGATVIESPWPGANAVQRQVYLDYAARAYSGRDAWAVVLDADEAIVMGHPRSVVDTLDSEGLDWAMLSRMWLVDTPGGLRYVASKPHYPDPQLRLFRVRQGLRYTGVIHEILHGLGRGREVPVPRILHLDLLRTNLAERTEKVARYERLDPGSGVPRFYRFERYGYLLKPLPADDSILRHLGDISATTRVRLTGRRLRLKALQYHLTWRLVALVEWLHMKERRLFRRLRKPST
jgi:glycosyltransferase involved in cell wall biosynthesis